MVGRGVPHSQLEEEALRYRLKRSIQFQEWIPNSFGIAQTRVTNREGRPSCAALLSTPAFINILKNMGERFTAMFRRKAYLHHFTQEGMDEMEFT